LIGHRCKNGNVLSRVILISQLAFTILFSCVGLYFDYAAEHYKLLQNHKEAFAMVVIAAGPHLFPSRTQQLSPLTPMVLHGRLCGRVGSRRRKSLFAFIRDLL
jgi:hypothetical protein